MDQQNDSATPEQCKAYARRENEMSNDRAIDAEAACAMMRAALERFRGIKLMTFVMRESDLRFESSGGSTRHYARECLVPVMEAQGFFSALSSDHGKRLLEWAQQVSRYLESQKTINTGRPDYCCAAQEGFVTRARDLGLLERQYDE